MPAILQPPHQSEAEPSLNGSAPDSPQPESPLEEFSKLLEELRSVFTRLFSTTSELVRAQWRLTTYVLIGSAKLYALRVGICVVVALFALAGWWFLNSALWHAVSSLTPIAFLPPLALFALNSLTAAALYAWQATLRLQ